MYNFASVSDSPAVLSSNIPLNVLQQTVGPSIEAVVFAPVQEAIIQAGISATQAGKAADASKGIA